MYILLSFSSLFLHSFAFCISHTSTRHIKLSKFLLENVILWIGIISKKRMRYKTDFKLKSAPLPQIKSKISEIFQVRHNIWCLTLALTFFSYNELELGLNRLELFMLLNCKRVLSPSLASFPLKTIASDKFCFQFSHQFNQASENKAQKAGTKVKNNPS